MFSAEDDDDVEVSGGGAAGDSASGDADDTLSDTSNTDHSDVDMNDDTATVAASADDDRQPTSVSSSPLNDVTASKTNDVDNKYEVFSADNDVTTSAHCRKRALVTKRCEDDELDTDEISDTKAPCLEPKMEVACDGTDGGSAAANQKASGAAAAVADSNKTTDMSETCHGDEGLSSGGDERSDEHLSSSQRDSTSTATAAAAQRSPLSSEHNNTPNDSSSNKHDIKSPLPSSSNKMAAVSSSSSSSTKDTTESPISKLLSMVNNPDKIHNSSRSKLREVSASSIFEYASLPPSKYSSGLNPSAARLSVSSTASSTHAHNSSSSQAAKASSKPLSGFLPPYTSMYTQLHKMYASLNKQFFDQYSGDDVYSKRASSAAAAAAAATATVKTPPADRSVKSESTSSPRSSRKPDSRSDHEQPLDLSVKAKGLDLSVKSESPAAVRTATKRTASDAAYIPNTSDARSKQESSLKSLQDKFGGNSFSKEKAPKSVHHYLPYLHPQLLPMYGGSLYASALFNTHPWMQSEKLQARHELSPSKTPPTSAQSVYAADAVSSSSPLSKSSPLDSKSISSSKLSPTQLMSQLSDPRDVFYNKKYTNLKCSCKKEFETLYDLTIHFKESGHKPCNRVAEQHEFPKLVRGQDMWLNHGSEQTKRILRCIRCGESFKTLPDLTVHMMKTKHYTNIVGGGGGGGGDAGRKASPSRTSDSADSDVFRCFECHEAFVGMEQFSKHLVTTGHHKSPIVIQPTSPNPSDSSLTSESVSQQRCASRSNRSRTFSDSSDKTDGDPRPSLSRLLAYEDFRSRYEMALRSSGLLDPDADDSSIDSFSSDEARLRCEICLERVEMSKFVEHVRTCVRPAGAWNGYTTPLKKRRIDSRTNTVHDVTTGNGTVTPGKDRSTASEIETGIDLDSSMTHAPPGGEKYIQPKDDGVSGQKKSAISAMESFIERSFSSGSALRNNMFAGIRGTGPVLPASEYPIRTPRINGYAHSPSSRSAHSPSHSKERLYDKYLPPLYMSPGTKDSEQPPPAAATVKREHATDVTAQPDVHKADVTQQSRRDDDNSDDASTLHASDTSASRDVIKREKSDVCEQVDSAASLEEAAKAPSPAASSPHGSQPRYVHSPPTHVNGGGCKSPAAESAVPSALASLQGLVYGGAFTSRRGSDTTSSGGGGGQRLNATSSSQPIKDHRYDQTLRNNLHDPLLALQAQSALLASTGMAPLRHSLTASLSPAYKRKRSDSHGSGSHCSEPASPFGSDTGRQSADTVHVKKEASNGGGGGGRNSVDLLSMHSKLLSDCKPKTISDYLKAKDGGSPPADQRVPATRVNNHVYDVKTDALTDAASDERRNLKKSPYVYLPLDHSARFNKYYEMAHELSSSGKAK